MKKVLLVIAIGMFSLTSCNKETVEPVTPVEPVVEPNPTVATTIDYSFEFLAGDYAGSNNYTDIVIKVNGDSIGVLTSHTTDLSTGDIYNANGYAGTALTMDVDLNSNYTIEAYTASGQLIGEINNGQFLEDLSNDIGDERLYLNGSYYTEASGSPVGTGGSDCHILDLEDKLIFVFDISN